LPGVQTLASARPGAPDPSAATSAGDAGSTSVPWTIANKYYTADVHFETRQLREFASYHAGGVPAVIYVWHRGEARAPAVHLVAR
jgi:hypothetical protein